MNASIAELLKARLEDFSYVEKLAGLVRPITYERAGARVTIPVATNVEDVLQCGDSTMLEMVPDERYRTIVYFEDMGAVPVSSRTRGISWTSKVRLVCWMNTAKLGGSALAVDWVIQKFVHALRSSLYNSGPFIGVRHRVVGMPVKGASLFSQYTYPEGVRQYLMPPFDAFGLDMETEFRIKPGCEPEVSGDDAGCWTPPTSHRRRHPREFTCEELNDPVDGLTEEQLACVDAPGGECDPATVRNSDDTYTAEVESGGTLTLPNVTHTDSDGSPVELPAMTPFEATLCEGGGPCDDAHVQINGVDVIDLSSGSSWYLHVEYPDGTPVGEWNEGAERWEIPACPEAPSCEDAEAVVKNSENTILETESIPSGDSADIFIADAALTLVNTALQTIGTHQAPSGVPSNVPVPDTMVQLQDADDGIIGTPIAVPSGYEAKVEVPDATAVLKNSSDTTLSSVTIHPADSVDVIAPDADYVLRDSGGVDISSGAIPSGDSDVIIAPDGTVYSTDGSVPVMAVKSSGAGNLPDSVINYKDAANADQVTSASRTDYASGTLRPNTQIPRRELTRDGVGTGSYVTAADLIANTVPNVTTTRGITASWAAGNDETIPIVLPAEYQGQTFNYVSNTGTNGTITVSVDGGSSYAAPPFTVGASGVSFKRTTYAAAGSVLYEV